jgi:hypothetical protein
LPSGFIWVACTHNEIIISPSSEQVVKPPIQTPVCRPSSSGLDLDHAKKDLHLRVILLVLQLVEEQPVLSIDPVISLVVRHFLVLVSGFGIC